MKRKVLTALVSPDTCGRHRVGAFGFGGIVYDPTNYNNAVLRYYQLQQQLDPTPANLRANSCAVQPGPANGAEHPEHAGALPGHVFAVAKRHCARHLRKHRIVGQRHQLRPASHGQYRLSASDNANLLPYGPAQLSGMNA